MITRPRFQQSLTLALCMAAALVSSCAVRPAHATPPDPGTPGDYYLEQSYYIGPGYGPDWMANGKQMCFHYADVWVYDSYGHPQRAPEGLGVTLSASSSGSTLWYAPDVDSLTFNATTDFGGHVSIGWYGYNSADTRRPHSPILPFSHSSARPLVLSSFPPLLLSSTRPLVFSSSHPAPHDPLGETS